jgi:hypothetical protein
MKIEYVNEMKQQKYRVGITLDNARWILSVYP